MTQCTQRVLYSFRQTRGLPPGALALGACNPRDMRRLADGPIGVVP